ncbi:hypothetical protein Pcinc_042334 [Petrolisthes cinctipes]|uniref:Uncharacterized protein n=1 Tax=Petrolisthes cinctipes TaxID=88211 RepID=A0AAE1BHP3_PETCI|nr:hypothetical protein Pcinc_042334 [Petrolisthes cinctipes]
MKYSKESPAGGMLVPLEYKSLNLLMKGCDKNMAVARALQKERRRNKRREKENMWKRNNQRNAMQEPIVMHYPARWDEFDLIYGGHRYRILKMGKCMFGCVMKNTPYILPRLITCPILPRAACNALRLH